MIRVLLFLKYVSDGWFDHRERYERELSDPLLVERKMSYELFVLTKGAD